MAGAVHCINNGHRRCFRRPPLVADRPAREARQDRREDRAPRTVRHVPDGQSRGPARAVHRYSASHRPPQTETDPGMIGEKSLQRTADRTGAARSVDKRTVSRRRRGDLSVFRLRRHAVGRQTPTGLRIETFRVRLQALGRALWGKSGGICARYATRPRSTL